MALPKIEHPIFKINLPSNGNTIHFRPFTVKEEKILLVAEMSQAAEDIVLAVRQILSNCILVEIDIDSMPLFDLEYVFVQLRSKSVGNLIPFTILDGEDGKTVDIEVDLDDVKVIIDENHTNMIQLDEHTVMTMRYPTVKELDMFMSYDKEDPNQATLMVARHIDKVYDDEKIYDLSEETEASLCEWLDTFDRDVMEKVQQFWETMPTLTHRIEYKNSLGHDRSMLLKGLTDFFR